MALTSTYTYNMAASPKASHIGLNVLTWDFNSGAAKLGSISDVLTLGKIPNGALITDIDLNMGISLAAATSYNLVLLAVDAQGTYSAITTLIGSVTANASTVQAFSKRTPYKLSLSDDRAVQYAVLALNCIVGVSGTVSTSLQGNVKFLTDGTPS